MNRLKERPEYQGFENNELEAADEKETCSHDGGEGHDGDGDEEEEHLERVNHKNAGNTNEEEKNASKVVKKKKKVKVVMNFADTVYAVVRLVGRKVLEWKLTKDPAEEWDILWTDSAVQPETLARMLPFQKINHFPGMYSLARKNQLGLNLMKLRKQFPEAYDFFPPTWLLPGDFGDFRAQFSKKSKKTFIIKPEASCQGRGIFLVRNWEDVPQSGSYVAQRYLHKPFLIDGLKFDLRIYVLLAGCDPLRVYLHKEGLARFATEPYIAPKDDNIDDVCMHLTNYAINKDNPKFVFNEKSDKDDIGHKRSLTSVMKLMADMGHDTVKLWEDIKKMIIKTFCAVQPILAHHYKSCQPDDHYNNMCFELLGFDIILDHKFRPYVLEVNHTPSFSIDTPLDKHIKKTVIRDSLVLMNISGERRVAYKNAKKAEMQNKAYAGKKQKLTPEERAAACAKAQAERDEYENAHIGDFTKIYPLENPTENYSAFIEHAHTLYQNYTGISSKRTIPAKTQANEVVIGAPPYQQMTNTMSKFNSKTPTNPSTTEAKKPNKSTHTPEVKLPVKRVVSVNPTAHRAETLHNSHIAKSGRGPPSRGTERGAEANTDHQTKTIRKSSSGMVRRPLLENTLSPSAADTLHSMPYDEEYKLDNGTHLGIPISNEIPKQIDTLLSTLRTSEGTDRNRPRGKDITVQYIANPLQIGAFNNFMQIGQNARTIEQNKMTTGIQRSDIRAMIAPMIPSNPVKGLVKPKLMEFNFDVPDKNRRNGSQRKSKPGYLDDRYSLGGGYNFLAPK